MRGGQALLHGGKARLHRAGGKQLDVPIWIEAEMLDDQPGQRLERAAESIEADGLAPEVLDRLEFRTRDERDGSRGHVAGDELHGKTANRRSDAISNHRIIVEFSAG